MKIRNEAKDRLATDGWKVAVGSAVIQSRDDQEYKVVNLSGQVRHTAPTAFMCLVVADRWATIVGFK